MEAGCHFHSIFFNKLMAGLQKCYNAEVSVSFWVWQGANEEADRSRFWPVYLNIII